MQAQQGKPGRGALWLKAIGWLCVLIGLLGILLPILPGLPILVVGLMALSTQHKWARRLLAWMRVRFRGLLPRRRGRRSMAAVAANGRSQAK